MNETHLSATALTPSFSDVALNVVRDSIRSAICIDDRYASAYEESGDNLIIDEPRKLYTSFRENGLCDLDIYRFTTYEESWKRDLMLSNKDLLILDWELDSDSRFDSAIKILTDVVESKKIPFVLVYTSTADLHSVSKALIRQFSPYDSDVFHSVSSELEARCSKISNDRDLTEVDIFMEEKANDFYEYVFYWNDRLDKEKRLLAEIHERFTLKASIGPEAIKRKISEAVTVTAGHHSDGLLELAMMAIAHESDTKSPFHIERIKTADHAFRLNGTIVLVYHKQNQEGGIKPEELFSVFAQAVISNPHNYLNILSLELKDRLRESFSRIGNQFSKTDEQAFFYHIENYRTLNDGRDHDLRSIYDFILKSWIGELHQQRINEQPSILQFVGHCYERLELRPPKELSETDSNLITELIRYCAYVSTSELSQRSDTSLRFGDLFVNSDNQDEFFLCVTPACDCLHPTEKINDNFYFVKGAKHNSFEAIQGAERGFFSFVVQDDQPKGINWRCKPFTSYISNNDISHLKINYSGREIQLQYLVVLKDTYAQRIANESFGYGHRVGIDLPH